MLSTGYNFIKRYNPTADVRLFGQEINPECKDNHEPIIGKREFDLVQRILGMDTRTSPNEEVVFPLSGLVICPDCGLGMVRKTIPVAGREYHY